MRMRSTALLEQVASAIENAEQTPNEMARAAITAIRNSYEIIGKDEIVELKKDRDKLWKIQALCREDESAQERVTG